MQATTLFLATIIATVSAAPDLSARHGVVKRCDATETPFHYNDTTIGTCLSCVTDVISRNTTGPALYETGTTCVDGPSVNYTVVSGDTLEKIAADNNSGVCNIAVANDLDNPDFILLGQVLVIPTDVCTPDNDSCRNTEGTATCVDASAGVASTYAIVSGDTFFLIASDLGITLDSLVAANPDADASNLQIGQIINIPICAE